MERDKGIQEELKSMGSPLAGMPRAMPYSVPAGYFEHLGGQLQGIVKETDGLIRPDANRTMPMGDVPAGYFNELPGRLLEMAKADAAQKTQQADIAAPRRTRLISITAIKWAAAAMLVLAMGIGSYRFLPNHGEMKADKILSSVPGNELHEYLQNSYRIDVDRVVNNNSLANLQLDSKDIISYLDETGWDIVD